jgi:hypothetical protein
VVGPNGKGIDYGMEGHEQFLWADQDINDEVNHSGTEETCKARHKVFLGFFVVNAMAERPGSGANQVFIKRGNIRLSWGWRHLIVGEMLGGVQLQEVLRVCGEQGRVAIFLNTSWGLKAGLDPKPATAKEIGSGLILALPRSSKLWMAAMGLLSVVERNNMMGLGLLPRLRRQVVMLNDGSSRMEPMEPMEPMLLIDFLKLVWFFMAKALDA